MLIELSIRNFALIEETRISFGPGLTILTGETGAGKSIILDAITLLSGGRSSADMIRQGADRAELEAIFDVNLSKDDQTNMCELLEQHGVDWTTEDTLIISRDLLSSGKSLTRINGRTVPLQLLKQMGPFLLDLSGQHENQSLLDPKYHLEMIDRFGGSALQPLLQEVKAAFQAYAQAKRQFRDAQVGNKERAQRIDVLKFQLQEIRALELKAGEEEDLVKEQKKLASAEKLFGTAQSVYGLLYEGSDRNKALLDQLSTSIHALESSLKYDDSLRVMLELMQSAHVQLEEVALEMRNYRDEIEFNPMRLSQIQERLAAISKLTRKYGENTAQILSYEKKIAEELHDLDHHEERLEELQTILSKTEARLTDTCKHLSEARREIAKEVCKRLEDGLVALRMQEPIIEAQFSVQLDRDGILIGQERAHVSALGFDKVEFLFSPNIGESPRPLGKIASGGELSRLLLTWKTLMAESGKIPTLIFDEIDTGISGYAAQSVAEQIGKLSTRVQILVVTHLPQVACMGDAHLQISKNQQGGRTYSHVTFLSEPERIEVLARMISGAELTETARMAAEEMLNQGRLTRII